MTEKQYYILAGQRLRHIREAKGFTQSKLSKITGVDQSMISKFENSGEKLSTYNLRKLLKAMDCTLNDVEPEDNLTTQKKTLSMSVSAYRPTAPLTA